VIVRRGHGLAASAVIAGVTVAALAACKPTGDVGYVEIKTVPVAPLTRTALYVGATRVGVVRQGSAVLRQHVGTVTLQTDGLNGAPAPLCDIVVAKDRVTTVTISVLDRPPRCQCRFSGGDPATARACVS
jgi:hypothetical protein